MKRSCWAGIVFLMVFSFSSSGAQAQEPVTEIIRRGIVKVIRAVDLKIQRMQNETLWLQNAQKALENTLSKTRLEEITGWVTKQRDLYQDYYDQLWRVKSAISLYAEIRELTRKQLRIVQAYKVAWAGVRKDQHFTVQELVYISDTYTGMLKQCLNNLQQVQSLVQSFTLEMTDGQRMGMISNIADDIDRNYSDLKAFNVRNVQISLSRARDEQELEVVRMIYGL
ncbi:conjugal transfer protein TraI [Cnuella takakiae]|nr:conjugal transfer protein TraI [Cnuella takakiae]